MRSARAAGAAAMAAILAGAAAVAGGSGGLVAEHAAPAVPRAAAVTSGSFTQLNSRAGLSIFSAEGLAPGGSAVGAVRITNAGTLAGRFTLSAADVSDTPAPAGGRLSGRLRLTVVDVTSPTSPRPVYDGALSAMPVRPLGHFRAGEGRTYRFTATLPDGGAPLSPSDGDNAYAGSSTRVRFIWDATAAPAGSTPPSPPAPVRRPAGERRPPRLRLSVRRVQRVVSRGYVVVRARCGEPCRLDVRATIRAGPSGRAVDTAPIRGARGGPRRVTGLRIRVPARLLGTIRRRLVRGGAVTVRLEVTARDRAGDRTVARRTLRLRRR